MDGDPAPWVIKASESSMPDTDDGHVSDDNKRVNKQRRSFTSPPARRLITRVTPMKRRRIIEDSDDDYVDSRATSKRATGKKATSTKRTTRAMAKDGNESSPPRFGSLDEDDLVELADGAEAERTSVADPETPTTGGARRIIIPKTPTTILRNKLLIASEGRELGAAPAPAGPTAIEAFAALGTGATALLRTGARLRTPVTEPRPMAPPITPIRPAPAPTSLPAPVRTHDVFGTPGGKTPSRDTLLDMEYVVMKMLANQPISAAVRNEVREYLNVSTMRVKGIIAARDLNRNMNERHTKEKEELKRRLAQYEEVETPSRRQRGVF
ncbi:hypothetical protein QBC47DRAFT_402486 [Echria macrotheca]|uniref:Uncharacterized protein n=1 Tax=Echria macrotheca TaxID=438768 RepID=A0AAJ0BC64_9PEZI|nr:hypothetical protein QBC47DRAFT_402486 [Echria macrotheca]